MEGNTEPKGATGYEKWHRCEKLLFGLPHLAGQRRLMDEAKSIEKNYGVVVNPVKNELVTFNEQDMIIVLSAH